MENVFDNVIDSKLTGNDPGAVKDNEGKTFSQEEVNSIIRDRLAKEKDKSQKQYDALVSEYQQKELNLKAKEIISKKGLSPDILSILKYEDETSLINNIAIIEQSLKGITTETTTESSRVDTSGEHGEDIPQDDIRQAMGLK